MIKWWILSQLKIFKKNLSSLRPRRQKKVWIGEWGLLKEFLVWALPREGMWVLHIPPVLSICSQGWFQRMKPQVDTHLLEFREWRGWGSSLCSEKHSPRWEMVLPQIVGNLKSQLEWIKKRTGCCRRGAYFQSWFVFPMGQGCSHCQNPTQCHPWSENISTESCCVQQTGSCRARDPCEHCLWCVPRLKKEGALDICWCSNYSWLKEHTVWDMACEVPP